MNLIKYCCLLLAVLLFRAAQAQTGVTITPSAYTAIDEVTITVDLAQLKNSNNAAETFAADVPYIWIFSNAGDAKTNGIWDNQTAAARLTQVSGTIWQFKFQADTLFGKTPGELKTYGFLIKTQNGSKKTVDFNPPYKFDPLVFTERDVRMFPSRASQDDLVYLYFKNELATRADVRRMAPERITIFAYDENNEQLGLLQDALLKTNAEGVKYFAFHPRTALNIAAGKKIKELRFNFVGKSLDTGGGTSFVASDFYTQELYNAK